MRPQWCSTYSPAVQDCEMWYKVTIQCTEQEFITVFSRRTTGFHRQAKVKTIRAEILDSHTVLAQSSSQLVNLLSAQPLINETPVVEQSIQLQQVYCVLKYNTEKDGTGWDRHCITVRFMQCNVIQYCQ